MAILMPSTVNLAIKGIKNKISIPDAKFDKEKTIYTKKKPKKIITILLIRIYFL